MPALADYLHRNQSLLLECCDAAADGGDTDLVALCELRLGLHDGVAVGNALEGRIQLLRCETCWASTFGSFNVRYGLGCVSQTAR